MKVPQKWNDHIFTAHHAAAKQSVQPTAFGAGGRGLIPCNRYGLQWRLALHSAAANATRWALLFYRSQKGCLKWQKFYCSTTPKD